MLPKSNQCGNYLYCFLQMLATPIWILIQRSASCRAQESVFFNKHSGHSCELTNLENIGLSERIKVVIVEFQLF